MRKFILILLLFAILGLVGYNLYPDKALPKNISIDSLVVIKSKRQLLVYSKGVIAKTYTIALGRSPIGDKQFEGDEKTPEGKYIINDKNPNSSFYKNLGVSYPDSFHISQASKMGKQAGGDIKIHGIKNGFDFIGKLHRLTDWTSGCMALTDKEIDELYSKVAVGTPISIYP